MRKVLLKLCSSGGIVILLLLLTITTVFAATPVFGGKFVRGVNNCTIYIDSASGAGYWQNYYINAANNWMYPGWSNPIYLTFVDSNYGSSIDIYADDGALWADTGFTVFAETLHYLNGNQFNPNYSNSNWSFTEIYINDTEFRKSSFSNEQALGTVIHEMGHAFGLAHTTNVNSMMCQTGSGRLVERVQKADNDAIVSKYQ